MKGDANARERSARNEARAADPPSGSGSCSIAGRSTAAPRAAPPRDQLNQESPKKSAVCATTIDGVNRTLHAGPAPAFLFARGGDLRDSAPALVRPRARGHGEQRRLVAGAGRRRARLRGRDAWISSRATAREARVESARHRESRRARQFETTTRKRVRRNALRAAALASRAFGRGRARHSGGWWTIGRRGACRRFVRRRGPLRVRSGWRFGNRLLVAGVVVAAAAERSRRRRRQPHRADGQDRAAYPPPPPPPRTVPPPPPPPPTRARRGKRATCKQEGKAGRLMGLSPRNARPDVGHPQRRPRQLRARERCAPRRTSASGEAAAAWWAASTVASPRRRRRDGLCPSSVVDASVGAAAWRATSAATAEATARAYLARHRRQRRAPRVLVRLFRAVASVTQRRVARRRHAWSTDYPARAVARRRGGRARAGTGPRRTRARIETHAHIAASGLLRRRGRRACSRRSRGSPREKRGRVGNGGGRGLPPCVQVRTAPLSRRRRGRCSRFRFRS